MRNNYKIDALVEGGDIFVFVKARRIGWLEDLERMDRDTQQNRILYDEVGAVRQAEKPRRQRVQEVEVDLGRIFIRNLRYLAGRRCVWRSMVNELKVHAGL